MKLSLGQLRSFLLGRLSNDDRSQLELVVAEDDEARLALEVAESNLIDEYAIGSLNQLDRDQFDQVFLTNDDRRERLAMAQRIVNLSKRSRNKRWLLAITGTAATVVFVAVTVFRPIGAERPVITLEANATRGSAAPEFSLKSEPNTLHLVLKLAEPPPLCMATMTRIGDSLPLLTIQIPKQDQAQVRLTFEKSTLTPGDYIVTLRSGERFQQDFVFRVAP